MTAGHTPSRASYARGCRCFECIEANRSYAAELARRVVPAYRSAAPARDHVRHLMAAGVGLKTIAKTAGLSTGALSKLIYGDHTRGQAPSKRIRPETHERIMSVTVDAAANGAHVDAAATWRLINAMTVAGVPKVAVARELGQTGPGLQLGKGRITAGNARAVADIHARWKTGDLELHRGSRHGTATVIEAPEHRPSPADAAYKDESVRRLIDSIAEAVSSRSETWRTRAQCRNHPTWMFFPARGDVRAVVAARSVCQTCPVQLECAEAGESEAFGVWAGRSARQRKHAA